MRIAEINDVASVASELTQGLRSRGHDVALIQPRLYGGQLPDRLKPIVAPVRAFEWVQILRRVRAEHYEILHIHYAYLGVLGALSRKPYILHCHGADVWGLTVFTRPLACAALRHAAAVFYSTPNLAPHVLPLRPDAEFLPNPIDWQTFQSSIPASASNAVYISCTLDDIKGAAEILDACRRLAASRPDIRFTAIGGGKYSPEFSALPTVTLLQHQPRSAMPELLRRHGLVVGQMHLGAAGMAELEAIACARPVIHRFDHPGAYPEPPPFIAAATGSEIAAAIVDLVDHPARRDEIGAKGCEWVRRYHDLDHVAARVEEVAQAIIRGKVAACAAGS